MSSDHMLRSQKKSANIVVRAHLIFLLCRLGAVQAARRTGSAGKTGLLP